MNAIETAEKVASSKIEISLNGDKINTYAMTANDGSVLVPADYLDYFNGEYQYDASKSLLYVAVSPTSAKYIKSYAKLARKEPMCLYQKQ